MKLFAEEAQLAIAFVPKDLAASASDGDWISLKHYRHITCVFIAAAGAAAEDPIITMEQATAVAGTGAKALTFTRIDEKEGADLLTIGQFAKVTQAAAATYNGDAGDLQKIVMVEFNAEDLDVEGGFDCVRMRIQDVGVTAQLGVGLYILSDPRYTPPPSAIVD
jgi:hypothetical protein